MKMIAIDTSCLSSENSVHPSVGHLMRFIMKNGGMYGRWKAEEKDTIIVCLTDKAIELLKVDMPLLKWEEATTFIATSEEEAHLAHP
jgi:hypothetical protein